jgi:hypothetical protein
MYLCRKAHRQRECLFVLLMSDRFLYPRRAISEMYLAIRSLRDEYLRELFDGVREVDNERQRMRN